MPACDDVARRRASPRRSRCAQSSDVAVVVAGVEEGEFRDRAFLKLPGRQEELIRGGGRNRQAGRGRARRRQRRHDVPVARPRGRRDRRVVSRRDRAATRWPTCCSASYNPAGRLPITFPMAEGQLPLPYNHKPTGRGDDYLDLTGMPLFPFGFGLSYTTFEYSDLGIEPAEIAASGTCDRAVHGQEHRRPRGDEVVQLYVRDVLGSVARPVMELKGFHASAPESRCDAAGDVHPRSRASSNAGRRSEVGGRTGRLSDYGRSFVERYKAPRSGYGSIRPASRAARRPCRLLARRRATRTLRVLLAR